MSWSKLHFNNNSEEISQHKLIAGYCIDTTSEPTDLEPYQKALDLSCSSFINQLPMITSDNNTCKNYWSRMLNPVSGSGSGGATTDESISSQQTFTSLNNNNNFTTRQMHWLSGGYFYGTQELRNYIYNETGTIHFSTNVKYDTVDSTSDNKQDFANLFDVGYGMGHLVYLNAQYPDLVASKLFRLNPVANSLGFNYNLFRIQGNRPIKGLVSTVRYNDITKSFDSKFMVMNDVMFDCGYRPCSSFESNESYDSENIMVMLSTGNITHFPLSNEFVNYTHVAVTAFTMMSDLYKTFYHDFVVPVSNLYNEANNLVYCSMKYRSNRAYYINNSFEIPYSLVTTAVSITDGTNTYGNWKWRVQIRRDSTTGEFYLNMDDSDLATLYNEFNEVEEYTSQTDLPYLIFDRIMTHMKSVYPDLNYHISLYQTTGSGSKPTLVKTNNILDPGTQYVSHIIEPDPFDTRPTQKRLRINISKPIKNVTYSGSIDRYNYESSSTFLMMIKASSAIKGYRNNTNSETGSYLENKLFKTATFGDTSDIEVLSEYTLFDETASKFSTPDYTSISLNTGEIIPIRGSEYSEIEKNNYPKIRYVRKSDGKFYIQILAGAFPYYHSLVHYTASKELEKCTTTMLNQGLCTGRSVVNSLKNICSKETDWYNHIATTKWICYVKHTEFGDDPLPYIQTESDKQVIKGPNQKRYGSSSTTKGDVVIGGGTLGGPVLPPLAGEVEDEIIAID